SIEQDWFCRREGNDATADMLHERHFDGFLRRRRRAAADKSIPVGRTFADDWRCIRRLPGMELPCKILPRRRRAACDQSHRRTIGSTRAWRPQLKLGPSPSPWGPAKPETNFRYELA